MPPLSVLLIGGVLPGVIALVLLALGPALARRHAPTSFRWIAPAALALAFVPASIVTNGHSRIWPVSASERGLAVAGVALLSAIVATAMKRGWATGVALTIAGAFGAFATLKPLHPHAVSTPLLAGMMAIGGVWTAAGAMLLGKASARRPGWLVPGLTGAWLFGVSLVLLFSAIATFAQLTGGLVAGMTSAAIVSGWKRGLTLPAPAFGVPLGVLASLLPGAWQLSPEPPIGAIVIAAATGIVLGAMMLWTPRTKAGTACAVGVTLVLIGAAVGWAYSIYAADSGSGYGY